MKGKIKLFYFTNLLTNPLLTTPASVHLPLTLQANGPPESPCNVHLNIIATAVNCRLPTKLYLLSTDKRFRVVI